MFNKKPISSSVLALGKDENGNQYGGTGYKSCFDITKTGLNIEKYKVRLGDNLIDVIPYNAGENHPLVVTNQCQPGDTMYSLDYYVHKNIGANGQMEFVCLKQFGKDCPCCNENRRLYDKGDEDSKKQATNIRAKRRCVYLVHDLIDGKIYYYDVAWFSFERLVNERAKVTIDPNTNAPVNTFDWETGRTIYFSGVKDTYKGKEFNKISEATIDLRVRAPLSDDVLKYSVDLSAGLTIPTADEMDLALCGKPVISEPVQTQVPVQNVVPPQPVQTQPVTPPQPVAQSVVAPQPVQTQSVVPPQPAPVQAQEVGSAMVCPHGHQFGVSDDFAECQSCELWFKCIDEIDKKKGQ